MSENRDRNYGEMTVEELERRLRETFFYTDKIDETVYLELERLRTALEAKEPTEFPLSPEESWEAFARENGEELARVCKKSAREKAAAGARRYRTILRSALIAAAVAILLAGAVLAAGPRLWAWVSGWSGAPEATAGSPIRHALEEMGITEPVYPSYLPDGYVLTEAHVCLDPLILNELYTRGDLFLAITITPNSAVEKALYPQKDLSPQEYWVGDSVHYLYSNDGSITAVWYTENYFVTITGNNYIRSMKHIIDSAHAG